MNIFLSLSYNHYPTVGGKQCDWHVEHCLKEKMRVQMAASCPNSKPNIQAGQVGAHAAPLVLPAARCLRRQLEHRDISQPPLRRHLRRRIAVRGSCVVSTACWWVGFCKGIKHPSHWPIALFQGHGHKSSQRSHQSATAAVKTPRLKRNCEDKFVWNPIRISPWDKHQVKLNHLRSIL